MTLLSRPEPVPGAEGTLSFTVGDMTCEHCASTIKQAIETSVPGTVVQADPVSKIVAVCGASGPAEVRDAVAAAGYTPSGLGG